MNEFRSIPNRVQNIFGSYLTGKSVIVVGTSAIFLDSLFEHLANQGANVAVFHNINEIHGDIAPPCTLVVFELTANRQGELNTIVGELRTLLVEPKILLIGDVETQHCTQFISSTGVAGILTQQASALQVCGALSLINSGLYVIPSTLLGASDPKPLAEPPGGALGAILSGREKDVLAGLCEGESNKQIARRLQMAEPTVRAHVRSILVKLGASNRTQASIWAIRHGFGAATGEIPSQSDRQPDGSGRN